jgi:NhaP-type Na+/H+ or K+/H+ antiporter
VVRGLRAYPASTVAIAVTVTVGVVLLLRPLWLVTTQHLPGALRTRLGSGRARSERALSAREITVLSWAGTRGVISLAAIFTLPLTVDGGKPFPARDLLLFCTFVVVVVTLVGQGVTFGPIARALGVHADPADASALRNEARAAAARAGLDRLDQLAEDPELPAHELDGLRATLETRERRYQQDEEDPPVSPVGSVGYTAVLDARRAVIDAQREELLRWRDAGRLPDTSLRVLERELDHEERTFSARDGH